MKLFCLLLQVGCVAVCFGAEPASPAKPQAKEPVYRGKTLSQWATRAKDWDKQVRMEAITALGEMGPAASAALTEQIKDDDVFVRDAAIMALGKTGPGAIATLTGLFKANDMSIPDAAARALAEVGPAAIPAILESLRSGDPRVRWAAAWALGYMGPAAKTAVPALAELLKYPDRNDRYAAALALGKIGPAAAPTLTKLLHDKNAWARVEAAGILTRIGPGGKEVTAATWSRLERRTTKSATPPSRPWARSVRRRCRPSPWPCRTRTR